MNANLSDRTKIGRIATFLMLTFGLSTIFYVKMITGGEGIAPWTLPLMWCPAISAIITKLIFDRNLRGLGWKSGPAKWLGLAYLLPILYGAVVYGITWLVGQGGFTTDGIAGVASELGMSNASSVQMVAIYTLLLGTFVFLKSGLPAALGEELGWRGFLFPELERMTSLTTASLRSLSDRGPCVGALSPAPDSVPGLPQHRTHSVSGGGVLHLYHCPVVFAQLVPCQKWQRVAQRISARQPRHFLYECV